MKSIIITFFLLCIGQLAFAQNSEAWISFRNEETNLMGFKNSEGEIMIEPKFMGATIANRFDNIIGVMEESNGEYGNYYLTKLGKKVGLDSLYILDNSTDCESEGNIRFKDKITGKVGMFDKNGNVVVPAVYDVLSITRNGLIWALYGAEKKYWDNHQESGCNHYSWEGGRAILIDTTNNVLAENFKYENALNFYSLQKTEKPHSDSSRISFLATDGSYYSFVEFEKEFKHWVMKELLDSITAEKLIAVSADTIIWESENGWSKTPKTELISKNFTMLKNGLQEILQSETDYFIASGGLNPFMYDSESYDKYYNNCGQAKEWVYPTMSIIVNHKNKKDTSQNQYEFLRTEEGYKLISLVVRDKKMSLK